MKKDSRQQYTQHARDTLLQVGSQHRLHRSYSTLGSLVVATLVGGGSAFSAAPGSSAVRARQQSRHMMTAAGQGGRDAAELPTSRKDVIGAVFGAVAASSFAFVAAADAKVCALWCNKCPLRLCLAVAFLCPGTLRRYVPTRALR